MDLIQAIRRENWVDLPPNIDPKFKQAVKPLQENLERALTCLSSELYSKPTHFLLEFIQNADDNSYGPGLKPSLEITIHDSEVIVSCNETGFGPANVRAICRIGGSTKKNASGYIGEKGIGFKSVFKVADVIFIQSNNFKFKFNKNDEMGMITPIWTPERFVRPGWTDFHLHLSGEADATDLAKQSIEIQSSLLLFLRKLASLKVTISLKHQQKTMEICRSDISDNMIKLKQVENGRFVVEDKYFTVKYLASTYEYEEKRTGIAQSEIVLAFPLAKDDMPIERLQPVHAFLPLRSFGFKFIIQADFLTASNREDVLLEKPWNQRLRDGIKDAFLEAVERFKTHPTLQSAWFCFLPNGISDQFFHAIEESVVAELRRRPIIQSSDGIYRLPCDMVLPGSFCDGEGKPLIPTDFLPAACHYLSSKYDVQRDSTRFRRLGVKDMSDDIFLRSLKNMEHTIPRRKETWLEEVCARLLYCPTQRWGAIDPAISALRFLPLCDGSWVSPNVGNIFFNSYQTDIPHDLDLRLLSSSIDPSSKRYQLFKQAGVQEADPRAVACKIIELHSRGVNHSSCLLQHARFMFTHRNTPNIPRISRFKVFDEYGCIANPQELYMDIPNVSPAFKLKGLLEDPARFLHPVYLAGNPNDQEEYAWWDWLRDSLMINVTPRLIDGHLSPEFIKLTTTIETSRLLVLLKEFRPRLWKQASNLAFVSELSDVRVSCENGTELPIRSTYLRTKSLQSISDLPFLPIADPDNEDWNFLTRLGVASRVDGSYYLKRLLHLRQIECTDHKTIENTYQQLQARFEDDPESIRDAFDQKPLFFVTQGDKTKKWLGRPDVVWSGPSSMRSKTAIKASYPHLETFFQEHLAILNAPPRILADELLSLCSDWTGSAIPDEVHEHISVILCDIARVIESKSVPGDTLWLHDLLDEPIFPVNSPSSSQEIVLRAAGNFYVTDPTNKTLTEVFRSHVHVLSLEHISITRFKPLLEFFGPKIGYLTKAVHTSLQVLGERKLDLFNKSYISKVEYLERLLSNTQPSTKISGMLRKLDIVNVDSITITYGLENIPPETRDAQVAIEHGEINHSILISRTNPPVQYEYSICKMLAELSGISMSDIYFIIFASISMVELYLDSLGAPLRRAVLVDDPDPEWMSLTGTLSPRENTGHSSNSGRLHRGTKESYLDGNVMQQFISEVQSQAVSHPGFGYVHMLKSGGPVKYRAGGRLDQSSSSFSQAFRPFASVSPSTSFEESTRTWVVASNGHPHSSSRSVMSYDGVQQTASYTSSRDLLIGFLGELYVYEVLLGQQFPNFGPDNWTSELRGHAPGFAPYAGISLADFTYSDTSGVLTELIFGRNTKDAWQDRWPTYFLEVKSTSGMMDHPFHMSHHQLARAFEWAITESSTPPGEVYAIVRVAGVPSSLSFEIFPDPHRLLFEGAVRIVSDVEIKSMGPGIPVSA